MPKLRQRGKASGLLYVLLISSLTACGFFNNSRHASAPPSTLSPSSQVAPTDENIDRGAPGTVAVLTVSMPLRKLLGDLFYAHSDQHQHRSAVYGPSSIYYGVIFGHSQGQDEYYAVADISFSPAGSDRPLSLWHREGLKPWTYQGELVHGICVPESLYNAWDFPSVVGPYARQHCPS